MPSLPLTQGAFHFYQKFRNFRKDDKWYGNIQGKLPESPWISEKRTIFWKFRDENQMEWKFPRTMLERLTPPFCRGCKTTGASARPTINCNANGRLKWTVFVRTYHCRNSFSVRLSFCENRLIVLSFGLTLVQVKDQFWCLDKRRKFFNTRTSSPVGWTVSSLSSKTSL